jgi:carnitine O-acetyltransferase
MTDVNVTPRVSFKNSSSNMSTGCTSTTDTSGTNGASPHARTYDGQADLPRLPIPTLEETLDRFPSAVRALFNPENESREMEECLASVRKFLEEDGPKLQQLLVEYEWVGRENGTLGSYVEEFWSDAYLAPDSSVVINLNPFFVLEVSCLSEIWCCRSSVIGLNST